MPDEEIQENGELESKENEVVVLEKDGATSETSDTTGETGEEEKLFDQEAANKAFIRSKQKLRVEQDEKAEVQRKLDEAESKLAESKVQDAPVIPPLPDQFDDDYASKMAERDQTIIKLGEFNRNKAFVADQQKTAEANQVLATQEAHKKTVQDYQAKAVTLGVDEKELFDAENVVGAYIRNPEVARFLMTDDNGPIAVSHLAKNPMELDKISKMSPMHAAIYISSTIIPAAVKSKPGPTQTPDPLYVPGRKGAPKAENPYLKGTKIFQK